MPTKPVTSLALEEDDDDEQDVQGHDDHERPACGVLSRVEVEGDDMEEDENADREGDDDRVDRRTAFLRPVDVLEVEDERELVEDERGAGAEDGAEEEVEEAVDRPGR